MPFQGPAAGHDQHSKKIIIFNHIPKCGGSTLSKILIQAFPAFVPVLHHGDVLRAVHQLDALPDDVVLTSGHFVWGIEDALAGKRVPHYVTLLREPLSLFRSFCTYQVKRYNTTVSLQEYLRTSYQHNPLCEFLGGGDVEVAKQRLERYAAFGILKEFGLSLALIAKRLGFSVQQYETVNVSNSRSVQLDPATEKEFRRHNALDLDLYAWALERFRRETRQTVAVAAVAKQEEPCEVDRKYVPYTAEATRHMAEGRFGEAIALIEEHGITLDGMSMANLYRQAGDFAGYKRVLFRQWKANQLPTSELAFGLAELNPRSSERILRREIARYARFSSHPRDSRGRRYLVDCHRCLGLVGIQQGRSREELAEVYRAGLALDPACPGLALPYAHILAETGRHRRAVQVLEQVDYAILSLTNRSRCYDLKGKCHAALGEHDSAQACFAASYDAQPQADRLVRYLGSLYAAGSLSNLGRVMGDMVLQQRDLADPVRTAFEPEILVAWYLLLLKGWLAAGEIALFEQGRQELLQLCSLAKPRLRHLDDNLLVSFADELLGAGRRADLLAILTIFLRTCARSHRAGLQMLLGRLHLLAGRGGPAVDLFHAACAADPGKAGEVLRLAGRARENGNLGLAERLEAAARSGEPEMVPIGEARVQGMAS